MATGGEPPNPGKFSWADEVENEENEKKIALSPILPPRQVIGPDDNGIKKVIEYRLNEDGNKVKVTSTFRVRKVVTRMSKGAIERRSWPKFGDAVNEEVGRTVVSTEEIFLETKGGVQETKATGDALVQGEYRGGCLIVCRTCDKKGDHFTARCPYKDLLPQSPESNYESPSSAKGAAASSSKVDSNTYIPPSMREGANKSIGTEMRSREEEYSIRVSNLSAEAQESDLHELFCPFGRVTRIFVGTDSGTGLNFAFVTFDNKENAEKAINKLDRYGYDNLILKVEWALPKSK